VSFTLEWLNCTAVSKNERAAHDDIRAWAEVESSADEFEIAPGVLRAKPDAS
jgi:hypothetical protein